MLRCARQNPGFGGGRIAQNLTPQARGFWRTFNNSAKKQSPLPILFDTGAAELLRRGSRDAEQLALQHYPPVLCLHVVAEYLFGQVLSGVSSTAMLQAQEYLESFEILRPDLATASIYARIRSQLKRSGIILPDPDVWISAHALQQSIPLASTDKDFERIGGLRFRYLAPVH